MLTPQEVQEKKFPKSLLNGYEMGEVDDFLDAVSADYAALYKENVVLKNKLKVLAEKVEEYRSVDAAMRKALLAAQRMAAEITEEAKKKSDELRTKAQIDYENSLAALRDNIKNEERRLEILREETSRFAEASVLIYQKQIDTLRRMISEPAVNKASPVDKTAEIIEQNLKQVIDEEIAVPPSNLPGAPDEHDEAGLHEAGEAVKIPEPPGRIVDQVQEDDDGISVEEIMTEVMASEQDIDQEDSFIEFNFKTPADDSIESGYNNYDQPSLFRSDADDETGRKDRAGNDADMKGRGRDARKPKDINVGGMSVRVFELDLDSDKNEDDIIL